MSPINVKSTCAVPYMHTVIHIGRMKKTTTKPVKTLLCVHHSLDEMNEIDFKPKQFNDNMITNKYSAFFFPHFSSTQINRESTQIINTIVKRNGQQAAQFYFTLSSDITTSRRMMTKCRSNIILDMDSNVLANIISVFVVVASQINVSRCEHEPFVYQCAFT